MYKKDEGEFDLPQSGYFETALWQLGNPDNPIPLDPHEVNKHRLALRRTLIDSGLNIELVESNGDLTAKALVAKMRRLTDRGAVLAAAFGEFELVKAVAGIDPKLTRKERFDLLWPALKDSRIIAFRAALQRESEGLPLLESGEAHSKRRGAEQFAADLLTTSLVSPLIDEELINGIVRKMNMRVGKHLMNTLMDHQTRERVRDTYFPDGVIGKEVAHTSQVQSPDLVLALLKDVASTPSDQVKAAFGVNDFSPWVLLGNDVKPPKKS